MSEYGLKIKNIKAGSLFGYNLGVRDHYDYTDAMLSNSLFSEYMLANGMKTYKGESTRDIICLDFDYGTRSYEEEKAHVESMISATTDEGKLARLNDLLIKIERDKYKYRKYSKDEIREMFYENGVDVRYEKRDKEGNVIKTETLHYRMLYRNSSKAKIGQVCFIVDRLYRKAYKWLTMGIKLPKKKAKIVEMSAYAPLTTSTIIGKIHIPVENILILEDCESVFRTMASVVTAEDYESTSRVLDEEATERAKNRAIAKSKLNIFGKPIYSEVYKTVPVTKKRCVVSRQETDVKNVLFDGMALLDNGCFPSYGNSMLLLRGHFFKACAFRSYLQTFFKDWCAANGADYETYTVKDMFGNTHLLKDVKMITTDNAIKWKKFKDLMGGDLPSAYNYWCEKVNADGSYWGIVKTDHPSKLGTVQQMSYQMINSLPCTESEMELIAKTSVDYVETLKRDNDAFRDYLLQNANIINHYEMLAALYDHNHDFANSNYFRLEKKKIINQYVFRLRGGKITVNGDNLTLCGNPYALLLYAVGDDWESDPTFESEPGTIQCYTTRFEDKEFLCGFRSPQNSCENIVYLHNHYSYEMGKYFKFDNNIIAVNCIHTDIQPRLNGADLTYKVGFRET